MTISVHCLYNNQMLDIAKILSELEAERERLEDALKRPSRSKPPGSDGAPPNPGAPAHPAGIGYTRSRRETRREPS
jgi:hypothetical protein